MWRSRTFTFVLPAKGSPTTTQPRKTDWSCAATGPTPARAAPSSTVAPPARSDGSPDGNMSVFSRRCSAGSTHFRMKTLKHVGTEMALHVLAYNMKRVMRILGVGGLMEAIHA